MGLDTKLAGLVITAALAVIAAIAPARAGGEVNLYSFREPALIQPLLNAFESKSGVTVNLVFAKDGLIERIAAEDTNSPADLLLTNEFGLMILARDAGITQPASSPVLAAAIPASLRDPDGHWIALTRRARVVFASKGRVAQDTMTYEELADPKWRGKICTRSGQHTYNIALISAMIAHLGEAGAQTWLEGVRDNLARKPSGSDRDQMKGVYSGECDLAIGNTYYLGLALTNDKQPEQKEWANSVKVLFPNAGDRGTHVNATGAVLLKHAPHRDNAMQLLEYLVSAEAQALYASLNHEYPARDGIAVSDLVQSWGMLKPDPVALETLVQYRKAASELVDRIAFDDGPAP